MRNPAIWAVKRTGNSWDHMPYDLLVEIMKRVPWSTRLTIACFVSKSWLSAMLVSIYPSRVIDLRPLDFLQRQRLHFRYCSFLKHVMDSNPADAWSKLILSESLLKFKKYEYLAKRTPSLKELVIPRSVGITYFFIVHAMVHWRKLKRIECPGTLIQYCASSLRNVRSLRIFGVVSDEAAAVVRDFCPKLRRLRLMSCALSLNALGMILNRHKNLELLDTRHCFRVHNHNCMAAGKGGVIGNSNTVEWNEEEIRHKAAGVKLHRRCYQHRCARCAAPFKYCVRKPKKPMNDQWSLI